MSNATTPNTTDDPGTHKHLSLYYCMGVVAIMVMVMLSVLVSRAFRQGNRPVQERAIATAQHMSEPNKYTPVVLTSSTSGSTLVILPEASAAEPLAGESGASGESGDYWDITDLKRALPELPPSQIGLLPRDGRRRQDPESPSRGHRRRVIDSPDSSPRQPTVPDSSTEHLGFGVPPRTPPPPRLRPPGSCPIPVALPSVPGSEPRVNGSTASYLTLYPDEEQGQHSARVRSESDRISSMTTRGFQRHGAINKKPVPTPRTRGRHVYANTGLLWKIRKSLGLSRAPNSPNTLQDKEEDARLAELAATSGMSMQWQPGGRVTTGNSNLEMQAENYGEVSSATDPSRSDTDLTAASTSRAGATCPSPEPFQSARTRVQSNKDTNTLYMSMATPRAVSEF